MISHSVGYFFGNGFGYSVSFFFSFLFPDHCDGSQQKFVYGPKIISIIIDIYFSSFIRLS